MDVKRILIFSTAYFPLVGGAEVAVKEITDRLGKQFEFIMVTTRLRPFRPSEKIGNVQVVRVGLGIPLLDKLWLAYRGHRIAEQYGTFDAIWSIMASYGGFAALAYKKKHPNTKFLLTLQEGDSKEHIYGRAKWRWQTFKEIFAKADRIQAISHYLADWAKELGAAAPVEVVPNGFNKNLFNKSLPPDAALIKRKEFGINHSGPLILSASRLVEKNGIDILIRALALLPSEYHLAIAGTGASEHQLRKEAEKMQVTDRVYFLGFVPHTRLQYLYAAATLFCRPSRSEGLGNVFLEAFASRLPVVATKVGGIVDVVKDGETGLLAQVEDPQDVASKILMLQDEQLREKIIETAATFARTSFDWDTIADQMSIIFKKL